MRKITKDDAEQYSLLTFFGDTVDDYIDDTNDTNFIFTSMSFVDSKNEYDAEYFEVLLSEEEYNTLSKNNFITFFTDSDERGKAGIYDSFIAIANNHCTNEIKPIAPLTYILSEDKYVLDIKSEEIQVIELKKVLFNHIIERGYGNLKDKFSTYFSYFSEGENF